MADLTLPDIMDLRAYERVREEFRRQVMEKKRRRRIPVGPLVSFVFECADTVRFQVQEMARVERIMSDEAIQAELDVYNRLLPVPGELSATLFIELTDEASLRHWLPRLVGIERAAAFEVEGDPTLVAESSPEVSHDEALTRESVTPAVHYLRFSFTPEEVARFSAGPVALCVRHPAYNERTELTEASRQELLGDLLGTTQPIRLA